MTERLTMLCVHAHPDDESSTTGGVLRTYADQGVRTVLVTCTDGALGDAPDGTTPEAQHHDPAQVAEHRAEELQRAAAILGIARVEMLGYPDSGMEGWAQNDATGSFWSTPVDEAAARLVPILLEERPQVVVTYDEIGFYGHPDHIQAHRVTRAALESSGLAASLFYPAIPSSAFKRFREVLREADVEGPGTDDEEGGGPPGTPDEKIDVVIDVSAAVDAKFDALAAHASQTESSFFLKMGRDRFRQFFGTEWFVRAIDPLGRTGLDHDLFAGWRD
ncbi:MAG TPA: PIG-L family deacetylase [Acidimicrobiales bacterium]|jgi:LmbE family N-acetylglucosaminyl deacetylase|nr:PIG-L family deacetylase [Acidimicrobiales bacterium]